MRERGVNLIIELIRWILTFLGGAYTLRYGIISGRVFPIMVGILLIMSIFIIIRTIIDLLDELS